MIESELINESIERIRESTQYIMEHEQSADVVLKRVSGKLMQLIGAYRLQGVCPTRKDLEDCCAMILAIGIACDAKPV